MGAWIDIDRGRTCVPVLSLPRIPIDAEIPLLTTSEGDFLLLTSCQRVLFDYPEPFRPERHVNALVNAAFNVLRVLDNDVV